MIKNIKKPMLVAAMVCAVSIFGLASCNEGTEPGETNTERSGIREADEMNTGHNPDTDTTQNLERYYEHTDSAGGAVHAGDGQRQKVRKEDKKQ